MEKEWCVIYVHKGAIMLLNGHYQWQHYKPIKVDRVLVLAI